MTTSSNVRQRHLVSISQAADFAACNPKTIRRRIADGSLTGYRMGPRLLRVDMGELEAQLLRRVPTTESA